MAPQKICFIRRKEDRKTYRDVEKIDKQRIRTSRQNLVRSSKNCDREDGMEDTRNCPMHQTEVKGKNGNTHKICLNVIFRLPQQTNNFYIRNSIYFCTEFYFYLFHCATAY